MDIEAQGKQSIELDEGFLRARRTVKWHHYDDDVLPCWVADMDFAVAPEVRAAMDAVLDSPEQKARWKAWCERRDAQRAAAAK